MSSMPKSDSTNSTSTLAEKDTRGALTVVEEKIGARELRRRLWHMAPGFLPFILWPISHRDPVSPRLRYIILAVSLVVAGRIFLKFREIERHQSESRAGAVLGYLLAVVGTLLLFPGQLELAFLVLAVLAFGDGAATFGGGLLGGASLPWNQEKTVSGTVTFLLCGTLMGAVIYWGEANPAVAFSDALLIAGLTTSAAALAESLASRLNDNIRVGATAAAIAPLAHAWVIGF